MTPICNYSARMELVSGIPTVRLADAADAIEVVVAPSIGNRAIAMLVRNENILHVPFDDPARLKTDPHTNGIPFLAPWANRMPEGFWANGKKYVLNPGLDSIRLDQNGIPIHGLLTSSTFWEVADCAADRASAHVTSRLEFWKHPDLIAQWPFAHEYEMTYRLAGGTLEVSVTIYNRSTDSMPIAVGFHPYFQLPGVPIAEAFAHVPARLHIETDDRLIATGETRAAGLAERIPLRDYQFDDGFAGLEDEPFYVEGRGKRIEVAFGPKYTVAIVYAPPGHNYICFEPMSAVTNGINLAHEGKYRELQTVEAGGRWSESFRITPIGF